MTELNNSYTLTGMGRKLNLSRLQSAMARTGLNQAQLAEKIGVSRSATTKWLKGDDLPRPDKLLKIGMLLGLSFNELVEEEADPFQPVVAFRRKGRRKTKPEHLERARHMGTLLRRLAPHLPFDSLERPSTLRAPQNDYAYLQRVASKVREKIGVDECSPIHFRDLIGEFERLHAVVIPVLWGDKVHHENALHIYLPDSMTTWVYLNLDSNVHDFKFWMVHELGHVYAPKLTEDEGEDFADAFAQAVLFPEACAVEAYDEVKRARTKGGRVNAIKNAAQKHGISPTTVNFALQLYAKAKRLPKVDVGTDIYAVSTNFNKGFPSLSGTLFTEQPPSVGEYIAVARREFDSPFFDAVESYARESEVSAGYVEAVLQLPLHDAREVLRELR